MKLNQAIAITADRKSTSQKDLTKQYQLLQKSDTMLGISRTYLPINDNGTKLPPENRPVQITAEDVLSNIESVSVPLFDSVLTVDQGNQVATGDIVVDGNTIAVNVPVTTLLYLEKRLSELETVFNTIPVLDLDKKWTTNANNVSQAEPAYTTRTEKVAEPIVLYPATPEHPAQTQMATIDKICGAWTNIHLSGAMPVNKKKGLIDNVRALRQAVQSARELANTVEIQPQSIGSKIFDFLYEI